MSRIGRNVILPAEENDCGSNLFFFQQPGDYETITAVVPLAGNDEDALLRRIRESVQNRRRDTLAGSLHQRETRNTVLFDREAIEFAHFLGGND
jgi:hypothetical protein